LQADAAKLFHPITAETERQAATQAKEIRKITHAIQHLPADIAEEANFAKVLEEQQKAIQDAPPPAAPHMVIDPDLDLDVETIRLYKFKPPSELDLNDVDLIASIIEDTKVINTAHLGVKKRRKGITDIE